MSGYMQLIIVGNVGGAPEMKYLQNGVPVCNFSVAVNSVTGRGETRQEKTTWVRVAAWRELAAVCNQYLRKGAQVMVVGTVEPSAYVDKAGNPQGQLVLTAREVKFLGSRVQEDAGAFGAQDASDMAEMPF